jgi:hypothetical protein
MVANFRVVVTMDSVRASNARMVWKMKSWPRPEHRPNWRSVAHRCGCRDR